MARNDPVCKTGKSGNAQGMPVSEQPLHFEIRTTADPRSGLQHQASPLMVFASCLLKLGVS